MAGADGVIGRLGGEEFALLLPGRDSMAASRIGEAVARGFAERAARSDGLKIAATVSIGLAEAQSNAVELAALLSAADLALYKAKALGRNRMQIATTRGVSEAAACLRSDGAIAGRSPAAYGPGPEADIAWAVSIGLNFWAENRLETVGRTEIEGFQSSLAAPAHPLAQPKRPGW